VQRASRDKTRRLAAARSGMTRLDSPVTNDVDWIAAAVSDWSCTIRWTTWGTTPSPDRLGQLLWTGVMFQEVARRRGRVAIALLQLTNVHLDDGVADFEFLADTRHADSVDEAMTSFIDRAFDLFPLRKLCMSAAADQLELSPYLRSATRQAGCLIDHHRRGLDRFVDVNLYEIWRDA
jgi:hypothetical protein